MFSERQLIELLGVSRKDLISWREEALEGSHWIREESGRPRKLWKVLWTEAGVNWVKSKTEVSPELMAELIEKASEAVEEKVAVVVGKFRNPRILKCKIQTGKNWVEVNVLVRDSKNFVVGMEIPVRGEMSKLVAKKHPRFGGKW